MDSFDQFVEDYLITKKKVLDAIGDEWSAICYYLSEAYGIDDFEPELRKAYNSPIRYEKEDNKPSFSLFKNQRIGKPFISQYLWKDSGLRKTGDVFTLVKELYDLQTEDSVFKRIDYDFGLDLYDVGDTTVSRSNTLRKVKPPIDKPPAFIQISTKPFTRQGLIYWAQYGISETQLKEEQIYEVQYFWVSKEQKTPFTPKSLCFAYLITNDKGVPYYKLYQPFEKEFKFIQDYPDYFVEGWQQLGVRSKQLIITKSKKDCVVLHQLGFEAVSPRSESTMIPHEQMLYLIQRFGLSNIFILFDNDGKHNGHKYEEAYSIPLTFIPEGSKTKDVSDFRVKYGETESRNLITQLITNNNGS